MKDRVGQQYGDYRLLRLLGDANFGEVYLGEHVADKTLAALKILNTSLTNQKDLADFINEARTITLNHPHIVKLLDYPIQDGTPYLVLADAPPRTLAECNPKGAI